ncbi:MAG: maltose alpha-D-glucosyltransferase [Desulfobulbaceae bacterium]|nr:maltose alpha-D-glucosyltransferase [Desulfobulbaceae bacterium]
MPALKSDPLWYKDAIIYELHVKAFKDSNDDGTGDFRGLIEKLDYIRQLGVTAVWLLPFYPSPFRDDGYDISDYRGIHPGYGSLRDFRTFVREAHHRGIRVITELVINHTSDQHPWFQAARRAKTGSARRNYYVWSDTNTRFPETRIIFTDTEASNWSWDAEAKAFYWHRFFSHQPDLNHNNPQVVKAVLKAMRYWLDMGVDGLRLDAVPYLCVREGTNNENLPETHAVLKQFRKYLDQHYTGRMFLAEANQWPEDVLPYFGDGDECHMAFHFPLMPRMFMALRQEDRHPITDILDRTPPIPESCQWALFLRNHDELTLEMVSDAERDYMYREYAMDSRMKLNIGIRRRLAPLLDNSRRRMELLNSLLFSMPGSPVIYYGDELGMGDNIFLGDRDGVRTPMQWNMDRNGGFSRADPAGLYLPVIMDPVYGYQSVNVEAQERNPSSMLHFMRRMIALRRQHKALGRGSMDFLRPPNRAILAYIRRYMGEIILVVANLSRFVQPAELDLSEFRGRIPVEMIGRTEFPPIGDLPYFITLGPHSFYWFRLEPQAEPIKAGNVGTKTLQQVPQLTLDDMWDTLLQPEYLFALGNDILPSFLAGQRWFRGKAKDFSSCRMVDWCKLGASFYITFLQVRYETGEEEVYVMPLKIVQGPPAQLLAEEIPGSIVAGVKNRRGEGILYDALMDRASCDILFTAISDGRRYRTSENGTIRAMPTDAYEDLIGAGNPCAEVRKLGVEQSNTSIIIGESFVLKLYRKLEEGANPDVEMSLFLTEKSRFTGIARVAGTLHYTGPAGGMATIGMLQEFIPNRGDGWSYTLFALKNYFAKAAKMAAAGTRAPGRNDSFAEDFRIKPPDFFVSMDPGYVEAAGTLGRRTAQFHLALAQEKKNAQFKPVKATAVFTEQLAETISREVQEVLAMLGAAISDVSPSVRKQADRVLVEGPDLLGRIGSAADIGENLGLLIRHHGDYHLGQVLRTNDNDFILLDFEGEPLRPLAERRSKNSPLKDIAGMIRSFQYAVSSALSASAESDTERVKLQPWGRAWYEWICTVFLKSYFDTAGDAPFLPKTDAGFILEIFLLEKVFYELKYELNNRPDWMHIPLAGIIDIIDGKKTTRREK